MADVFVADTFRGNGKAKWITITGPFVWFTVQGCEWFSQIDCT